MSLEAIEKVSTVEKQIAQRKIAAAVEAKKRVADEENAGRTLLQKAREVADAGGRELLRQAEAVAQTQSEEILCQARESGEALCAAAKVNLKSAAEFIVGKVVNS